MVARNALANQRWNFDVPSINNLLQPIQGGIDRYNRQAQQGEENRRADEQLGMQRDRLGMEKTRFSDARAQKAKEAAGNLALLTLQESDPNRRAEKWRSFLATHPNAAGLDQRYHDPAVGPMAVLADAGMAQTYLDYQMKRAAEARAAESLNLQRNQDSRAAATHSAQMAQYQNMSPAQRQQAASTLGLQPGTPAFNTFLSTGQYTPPESDNKIMPIPENGLAVVNARAGTARRLISGEPKIDATTKKAIDEADDFVAQTNSAIASLNQALELNKVAYDGAGAKAAAGVVNNTIGRVVSRPGALATTELENIVVNQALSSLRATFGGNPTEGERKILLDVAGSVSQPAEVRERIFKRALAAAQTRLRFNQEKADRLRSGSYYKPGGQPPAARDAGPQTSPGAGGGQRYVNPQTGEVVEWNGRAYVRVGGASPDLPTADARGIPYPPASR